MQKNVVFFVLFSLSGFLLFYLKPSMVQMEEYGFSHYRIFHRLAEKLKFSNISSEYFKIDTFLSFTSLYSYDYNKKRTSEYLTALSTNLTTFSQKRMAFVTHFSSIKKSVCLILKNGHSVLRFVSCLLTIAESGDQMAFEKFDSLLTFRGAFTKDCNKLVSKKKPNSNNYQKVAFIRDPIDRFVSGWLFICQRQKICFNCGFNVTCFLTTLYNCFTTNNTYSKICKYKSSSKTAVHNNSAFIYLHLSPQAFYCNLMKQHDNFKAIPYSRENFYNFTISAAENILTTARLEQLKGRMNQNTVHAAKESEADELKKMIASNRNFVRMLATIYAVDYVLFKLDLPKYMVDFRLFQND